MPLLEDFVAILDGSLPYARAVLANKPWGYWRLGEAPGPAGQRANDASGNGHHGQYSSTAFEYERPGLVLGGNTAVRFGLDPTQQLSYIGNFVDVPTVEEVTVEIWVQFDSIVPITGPDNTIGLVGAFTSGPMNWGLSLGVTRRYGPGTDPVFSVHGTSGAVPGTINLIGQTIVEPGVLYHVVWTRDATNGYTMYLNGNWEAAVSAPWESGLTVTAIGYSGESNLQGVADEVAVYTTALSQTDVNNHFGLGQFAESEAEVTFGQTVFCSTRAVIPIVSGGITSGATLQLIETGGTGPENTQNLTIRPAFIKPGVQVTSRANKKVDAERLAWRAYVRLAGIRNQMINGSWYRKIRPLQQPMDLGLDDRGQIKYGFNVLAEVSRGDIS